MSGDHEATAHSKDDAIASLWYQHYGGLVRLAVGLTGDIGVAEELVQDAFAALIRRWGSVRDPAASHTYLVRTVVNGARARWRRRHRSAQELADAGARDSLGESDIDAQLDLIAALKVLPYGKRACLVLRYYADLSQAETAEILGVSVGTVKSQTAKGLHDLALTLDAHRAVKR